MSLKILFVEDDENFGGTLSAFLKAKGFEIRWFRDDDDEIYIDPTKYNLAIIDISLPNSSGFEIAKKLKSKAPYLRFFFLTARNQKEDVLKGYGTGAVDYLIKPVDPDILLVKINLLISKKNEPKLNEKVHIGDYIFDSKLRKLKYKSGEERNLSPTETQLLKMLCEADEFLPREKVLMQIWNKSDFFSSRSLDVYMTKIRKYLSADPNIEIINIKGSGFLIKR